MCPSLMDCVMCMCALIVIHSLLVQCMCRSLPLMHIHNHAEIVHTVCHHKPIGFNLDLYKKLEIGTM